MAQSSASPPAPGASPPRLMSLDALRGFDMFWIIGAEELVRGLNGLSQSSTTGWLARQFQHAHWEGFRFYDLIFPLFVFIVGVSLVFSLGRALDREGLGTALARVFRRSLLLFALGIFYSGGLRHPWPDIRLMGVLNRIALAYFFAGLLYCFLRARPRALAGVCAGLLLGYWAMLNFIPFPDVRPTPGGDAIVAKETGFTNATQLNLTGTNLLRGTFLKGVNLANYVDQRWLGGRKYDGTWDPEGLLSTLPAVSTCLLGVLAGLLLTAPQPRPARKAAWLAVAGLACLALGHLWGLQFPIIKKIWTSSYVLVAGGWSALLLAAFYAVVDLWEWRLWCQPFVWMGMNSITIYLVGSLLGDFHDLALRLAGGDVRNLLDRHAGTGVGNFVVALVALLIAFLLVRFLYVRKLFLRL